jgi:hypothetical protein
MKGIKKQNRSKSLMWLDELVMYDLPLQIQKKLNARLEKNKGMHYALSMKVRKLPDEVKGKIAHDFTRLYETYDKVQRSSHTHQRQFEAATPEQIEQLAKYLMHLIEVA